MKDGLKIHHKGFVKTELYFKNIVSKSYDSILKKIAEDGLKALEEATPKDTGETSKSWSYKIVNSDGRKQIVWSNSNSPEGVPVVILLQYGHASQNGVWIEGRDFINPALKPVFENMKNRIKEEVKIK